jgi:mannose-6-phosphate isomerase-like protein (cupin superfamily)
MRTVLTFTVLSAVLGVAAPAAFAQAPQAPKDASLYVGQAELEQIMQSVPPSKEGKPGSFSKRLFAANNSSTAFIRLNAPDQPHAHGIWSEVFIVKEGSGILETGGTITGDVTNDSATHKAIAINNDLPPAQSEAAKAAAAARAAQGDKAGTDIQGGHRQNVGPGDVILIPAGVAHRWFQVDKPVVYLDIKFPKAQ